MCASNNKPVYRMSEAGECSRTIAAIRLGEKRPPFTPAQKRLLDHASRHEQLIADYLVEETGLELISWGRCIRCQEELGDERNGIHVEIETPIIRLVGHLDRRARVNEERTSVSEEWYPVEIKSAGRFPFDKFRSRKFEAFPHYEAQEICYLEAEDKPGIYVVGSRDTGEILKYTIPYKGQALQIDGFESLEVVTSIDSIVDKLHLVEISVRERELPLGDYKENAEECRWCKFKYLCVREEREEQVGKIEELPALIEAAGLWKEGKDYEEKAKERIEQAGQIFLSHAKASGNHKFPVAGINFGYYGEKRKRYLDPKKMAARVDEKVLEECYSEGKVYDDFRIWLVKEE